MIMIKSIICILLCLIAVATIIYGFLMKINNRFGIKFFKVNVPIILVGVLLLTTVNQNDLCIPLVHSCDKEITRKDLSDLSYLSSVLEKTKREVGKMPSNSHRAYEDEHGKVSWVTKSEYKKLLRTRFYQSSLGE